MTNKLCSLYDFGMPFLFKLCLIFRVRVVLSSI